MKVFQFPCYFIPKISGHEGSIIAMERAAGELLDDVYQALSADEYEKLLFALGREMRNFHRINAGRIDEALLKEGSCDSHRSCAEEYSRDLANKSGTLLKRKPTIVLRLRGDQGSYPTTLTKGSSRHLVRSPIPTFTTRTYFWTPLIQRVTDAL